MLRLNESWSRGKQIKKKKEKVESVSVAQLVYHKLHIFVVLTNF